MGSLAPSRPALEGEITPLRLPSALGRPKIAYSFNSDDDLAAIRRAGFTHVLVSYLQGAPDEEQRRKLDDCQRHRLKLIYRMVDLVDRDRRSGGDARMRHAVMLLRDHPALAAWQTYEETNLPPEQQIAVYRKIKSWDPHHPVIIVITNEYSPGWYTRTYADEAQDVVMIDFYPYKRRYDGWPYIRLSVPALRAVQKRPVPLIPIIQASSAANVPSSDETVWPPTGGLEKQLNLWWSLGADAGVAFWLWRGSKEYPFVGITDPQAPPHALRETTALLARIPDGELPVVPSIRRSGVGGDPPERPNARTTDRLNVVPAVRVAPPPVNYLKNSGFEQGLEGWVGYGQGGVPTDQAYVGRGAARLASAGARRTMGIGQRIDLRVPPNGTVTFSAYYKVVRETTRLQWTISTTAFPKFGAAEFIERQERLLASEWRRGSVSATNGTGAPQRVTSVSVSGNSFTGEVLLDNLQLELAPRASAYTENSGQRTGSAARASSRRREGALLRFDLTRIGRSGVQAFRRSGGPSPRAERPNARTPVREWTVCGWSAPEVPPAPGSYACLAAIEPASGLPLELRLHVDAERSDPNGWVGSLEVALLDTRQRQGTRRERGFNPTASAVLQMPLALAPGQPLFWALSRDRQGRLTLRAAPAGYRLQSTTANISGRLSPEIHAVSLGTDAAGDHPLNGLVAGGHFVPGALSLAGLEHLRAAAGEP